MAPKATHASTVKVPGAATTFTNEAVTVVTGTTYQINDATKRVLDPDTAIVVYDDATPVACTGADMLFGTVTLTDAPSGTVTVSGKYLPLLTLALVNDFSIKNSCTVLDKTTLDSSGYKDRMGGLSSADFTIQTFAQRYDDLDSGGGVVTIDGAAVALYATPVLLSITPGGDTGIFRAWALLDSLDSKGSIDGLISLSMTLQGTVRSGTVGSGSTVVKAGYSWGT